MSGGGTARLARVIDTRMRRHARGQGYPIETGTIDGEGGIDLDTGNITIPAGDYEVLELYAPVPDPWFTSEERAGGSDLATFASHDHDIPRPHVLRPLQEGDRVVVAIANHREDEFTPIVIGRLHIG